MAREPVHGALSGLDREVTFVRESLAEAVRTLLGNRLRSVLAILALAIAVATSAIVSAALAAIETQTREATERALGADSFILTRLMTAGLGRREIARRLERNPPIQGPDVRFLERYAGDTVLYSPVAQRAADVSFRDRRFERAAINGTGADLPLIREIPIERGRFFLHSEVERAAQVAVVGREVAETLFPDRDPLGQRIRLAGRGFLVIGTLTTQGTVGGVTLDRYIWIPLPAYERAFGVPESLRIYAAGPPHGDPVAAEDRARATMRARRQLAPGEEDNFDIQTPEASRDFVQTLTARVGAAGPPISAMALLAAVVVVTNTILVSIAQRTREIGIRRAVGAKRAHIMLEVLAETGLIAVAGGSAGLLGALAALAVAGSGLGTPLPLSASAAAWALSAAAAAGLLAGWYPARQAASIEVTRALHRE